MTPSYFAADFKALIKAVERKEHLDMYYTVHISSVEEVAGGVLVHYLTTSRLGTEHDHIMLTEEEINDEI